MKLIIAIIQPYKLEEVKKELYAVNVNLITVTEVLGHGRQIGHDEFYRGVKETGNLLRKVQLEIAVNDDFVEPTIKALINAARTGKIGDGKIFVLDLPPCIRIRTG
ncbi:MAG: P-II family nitrogen regulator, partial [Candidatus Omnitrophica bacterium]|nr:P-II family nitrogen regulator [Candidatus Omnitrophota bacterium]